MRRVGVRALREQLTRVLADVQTGETVIVLRRGQPVARIEPVYPGAPVEVRRLLATGRASWSGQPLGPLEAVELAPGPAVSDILLAQRGRGGDALPGQ